jgi:hypothetical protein
VPFWKRTFLPCPDLASLAAFLVDDEEGATSERGYRRPRAFGDRGDFT